MRGKAASGLYAFKNWKREKERRREQCVGLDGMEGVGGGGRGEGLILR